MFANSRGRRPGNAQGHARGRANDGSTSDVSSSHAADKKIAEWQIRRICNQPATTTSIQYGSEPRLTVPILSNESTHLVAVLRSLSASDRNVMSFAYCRPAVNHIGNRYRESGLCGYRCITMLLSYLRGCATAHKRIDYSNSLPNILELQECIESAWKSGINAQAQLEIGAIRGTRKYIGTSEVEACLRYLNVPCSVESISPGANTKAPCDALLERVTEYFNHETSKDNPLGKAPTFLQRNGHSYVIVGIEQWAKDKRQIRYPKIGLVESPYLSNLVVFDCSIRIAEGLKKIRDGLGGDATKHIRLMDQYRLDRHDLEKYDRFELVFLT